MGYAAGVATALKVFQRHRIYLWKYFETAVMFVCFLSITDFKHLLLVFFVVLSLYSVLTLSLKPRKRNLEERGGNWKGVGNAAKMKSFSLFFSARFC